jgi:aerobic carbon-monoxide dehydrogenase large subunit
MAHERDPGHSSSPAVSTSSPWVGRPVLRLEDPRYLRGQGRYLDDLVFPRMAHLVVVRSAAAHARLRAVHVDAARRAPGVLAVVTAHDLAGRVGPLPPNPPEGGHFVPIGHPALAQDKVRYVGEPVAAVVADSVAAAVEAAGLVEIDYDPLPAVVDLEEAQRTTVLLHEAAEKNVLIRWRRTTGDVEEAFRGCARVVRGQFHIPRLVAAPMETRGAAAAYDPGTDLLTVWCSTQDPYRPRAQLSRMLGRPEDRIRVVVPDVGGAFGSKGSIAPEIAVVAVLAADLGRPVKWIETRRENFLAGYQGRGFDAEVDLAVDRSGRITAMRARLTADLGAYLYPATATVAVNAGMHLTGVYAFPAADVEVVGVATTKAPTGPYRGAGRPEGTYIIERMIDLAASELHLDPIDVRRRNLIPPDRFPYRTPLGFVYDSGEYGRALDHALRLFGYEEWRQTQRRARAEGRLVGIGIAMYVERAGTGLWESAAAHVEPSGRLVIRIGSTPHGQGHETTFAQIAADALGVDLAAIVVEHGDSAAGLRGVGTFGSRSITVGGSALLLALEKIRAHAVRIAAHLLEAAPEDIERDRDRYAVRGSPGRAVSLRDVAAAAYQPGRLPPEIEMGLAAGASFALPGPVFPSGAYAAAVEIARETGETRILKIVAVDDAGRVVNPLLAEGQVLGAVVQGLGQALVEEAVYDRGGQLVTATFSDYALLRAAHVPPIVAEFVETLSPFNPLGAKGVGEAGSVAAPAVVANAVMDALAPLGVRHVDFPLTPERLWRLVRGHPAEAAGQRPR